MKQLTAQQLSLYPGCKCVVDDDWKSHIIAVHTNGNIQIAHARGSEDKFEAHRVKPILRPLDTLGDDRRHIAALMFSGGGSYYNDCFRNEVHDNFENDVHVGFTIYSTDRNYNNIVVKYNKLSPLQFKYILEIGGDIFGWIKQGLAIEKNDHRK